MNSQVYCFLLCIWLFSCQDQRKTITVDKVTIPQESYNLIIKIKEIQDGKAYLNIVSEQRLKRIDSTTLKNGHFSFTGHTKETSLIWLTFDATSQGISLILENENITVTGHILHIKNAQIQGGPINTLYSAFKKESSIFFSKIDRRYQRFQKARLENNSEQLHLIYKEISGIKTAYLDFCITYIQKHPDSYISLIVLSDLIDEKLDKNQLQNSLTLCSKRLRNFLFAQKLEQRIGTL